MTSEASSQLHPEMATTSFDTLESKLAEPPVGDSSVKAEDVPQTLDWSRPDDPENPQNVGSTCAYPTCQELMVTSYIVVFYQKGLPHLRLELPSHVNVSPLIMLSDPTCLNTLPQHSGRCFVQPRHWQSRRGIPRFPRRRHSSADSLRGWSSLWTLSCCTNFRNSWPKRYLSDHVAYWVALHNGRRLQPELWNSLRPAVFLWTL
jgi:hypothetical protein